MPSSRQDRWGLPIAAASAETAALFDGAVSMMRDFAGQPFALTGEALKRDPDCALIHALRALLKLLSHDFRVIPSVAKDLAKARDAMARIGAPAREAAWLAAAEAWLAGDLSQASMGLERHVAAHPRDYMALHAAYHLNFALGRAGALRALPARAAPAWAADEVESGLIKGMWAFGLEETGEYARAEAMGRDAVAQNPRDAWAIHAVAHVMEMQTRPDEGVAWMESPATDWAGDRHLVTHQWWHLALFHLARDDHAAARALYDAHMAPRDDSLVYELHDGASMLWRLYLRGVDLGARAEAMADAWAARAANERYGFNDLHLMLALALADRRADMRAHLAAVEARAEGAAAGDWRAMALVVGVPLCRGLLAFAEERWDAAAAALAPARHAAQILGGSHAQRAVVNETFAEAARRAGFTALARRVDSSHFC